MIKCYWMSLDAGEWCWMLLLVACCWVFVWCIYMLLVLLHAVGCSWMLLDITGSDKLLNVIGYHWIIFECVGSSSMLLVIGYHWMVLDWMPLGIVGWCQWKYCQMSLDVIKCNWVSLNVGWSCLVSIAILPEGGSTTCKEAWDAAAMAVGEDAMCDTSLTRTILTILIFY